MLFSQFHKYDSVYYLISVHWLDVLLRQHLGQVANRCMNAM